MRRFKFRGKNKLTGEWVYGTGIHVTNGQVFINVDSPFGYEVVPESVGQFSGFVDKDGREIYEGDLLDFSYDNHYHKPVHKTRKCVSNGVSFLFVNEDERPVYVDTDNFHVINHAVIGTIYDK